MSMRGSRFWRLSFVATLMAVGVLWSKPTQAQVEVDIGFFYDGLAPYGQWSNRSSIGWVWSPNGVEVGWRPYVDGRWIYTDDFGWVWDSDYEWGWAPFHYGRWFYDGDDGWLWQPGMEWAPAWVTWRVGNGYVGWAPLPPAVTWSVSTGFGWGGFDFNAPTFSPAWTFVEERRFADPRVRDHAVNLTRNVELVRTTRDTTNLTVASGRLRNHSVNVAEVERAVGRSVPRIPVREVATVEATRGQNRSPSHVPIFRPVVTPARSARVPPMSARGSRAVGDAPPVEVHRSSVTDTDGRQRPDSDRASPARPNITNERGAPTRAPQSGQGPQEEPKAKKKGKRTDKPHGKPPNQERGR